MPSTSESLSMREWMTTQCNLTILTAILVVVLIAYGFRGCSMNLDSVCVSPILMTCLLARECFEKHEQLPGEHRSRAQVILEELSQHLGYSPPTLLERMAEDAQKPHQ